MDEVSEKRKKLLDMCGARVFFGERISIMDIVNETGYKRDSVNRVIWQMRNNTLSKSNVIYMMEKFGTVKPLMKPHRKVVKTSDRRKQLLGSCYNEGDKKGFGEISANIGYSRASVSKVIKQIAQGNLSESDIEYIGELFIENVFAILDSDDQVFSEPELQLQKKQVITLINSYQGVIGGNFSALYEKALSENFLGYREKIADGVDLASARNLERRSAFQVQTYYMIFNTLSQMSLENDSFSKVNSQDLAFSVKPSVFQLVKKES